MDRIARRARGLAIRCLPPDSPVVQIAVEAIIIPRWSFRLGWSLSWLRRVTQERENQIGSPPGGGLTRLACPGDYLPTLGTQGIYLSLPLRPSYWVRQQQQYVCHGLGCYPSRSHRDTGYFLAVPCGQSEALAPKRPFHARSGRRIRLTTVEDDRTTVDGSRAGERARTSACSGVLPILTGLMINWTQRGATAYSTGPAAPRLGEASLYLPSAFGGRRRCLRPGDS